MAEAFQFGYGNPNNYSDWAKYAGLDRKTGIAAPSSLSSDESLAPAAPPQSFGEMATQQFNQAIAPIQQKFTNISNAATQFGQGNFAQGVNAYRGYQPQPSVINQHYGVDQ